MIYQPARPRFLLFRYISSPMTRCQISMVCHVLFAIDFTILQSQSYKDCSRISQNIKLYQSLPKLNRYGNLNRSPFNMRPIYKVSTESTAKFQKFVNSPVKTITTVYDFRRRILKFFVFVLDHFVFVFVLYYIILLQFYSNLF